MPKLSTRVRRLAGMLLLALSGCGDDTSPKDTLPREAVVGTVTLDGQPLAQGTIQFDPAETNQGMTAAVASIKDGKYSIARDMGPVPGKYKISISSRAAIKISPGESPGPVPKLEPEKIPVQFNKNSTITKEVTNGGENAFTFELKSS